MSKQIFYIIDHTSQEFYFFEKHDVAKAKELELSKKYGFMKAPKTGISDYLDNLLQELPRYPVAYKDLKNYYGTIWYAFKWSEKGGAVHFVVQGRYKDLKNRKEDGYTIKKIVFTPYKEYMKQFEESDQRNEANTENQGLVDSTMDTER